MKQKKAKKEQDNIVRETHVYSGPLGEGYIDYEYRAVGEKLEVRASHVGPETRVVPLSWTEIEDRTEIVKQETSKESKQIDEVIEVIDATDPKKKEKKIERKTVEVPVYSDVEVVREHPYKKEFFDAEIKVEKEKKIKKVK